MATVEFGCEHCHQRLPVGAELRGSVVRCPHCQQFVLAPVPEPYTTAGPPTEGTPAATPEPARPLGPFASDGGTAIPRPTARLR
jgi:DNA-directed RNA polymerase subunit RPC12/RpoP